MIAHSVSSRLGILLSAVWLVAAGQPGAYAQSDAPPGGGNSGSSASESRSGQVEKSPLDTFYLKDKDGNPIPYFKMPFEEFEEIYRQYKRKMEPDPPKRFALKDIQADGEVKGGRVELTFKVEVVTLVDGWIRVPLGLANAIVHPESKSRGAGAKLTHFFEFDAEEESHMCWIRGTTDQQHAISFTASAPTHAVGASTSFKLNVPRVRSRLKLRIPGNIGVPTVSEGSHLQDIQKLGTHGKLLTILSLRPGFEVTWSDKPSATDKSSPTLRVRANIETSFVGKTGIHSEARIKVRSSGEGFDAFDVRLPPGMKLDKTVQAGYRVSVVEPKTPKAQPVHARSQIVRVELDKKTTATDEIRLIADSINPDMPVAGERELAGFDVLGSPFQTGVFDLIIDNNWTLQWTPGPKIRREEIPQKRREAGVVYRFAYDGQPCSLQVQVVRRRQHLEVTPAYRLDVDSELTRLEAKLSYRVRGGRIDHVDIKMPGWEVQPITGQPLVDTATTQIGPTNPLVINLSPTRSEPLDQFTITIQAIRRHSSTTDVATSNDEAGNSKETKTDGVANDDPANDDDETSQILIPIPQPDGTTFGSAEVTVVPAANVVLTPDNTKIKGLTSDSAPSVGVEAGGKLPPLYYRKGADSGPATFASRYVVKEREVSIISAATCKVAAGRVDVRHHFTYDVEYEPISILYVDVPKWLLANHDFKIVSDQEELDWVEVTDVDLTGHVTDFSRLHIDLRGSRLGQFSLQFEFTIPLPELARDHEAQPTIPLVAPADPAEASHVIRELAIVAQRPIQARPAEEDWSPRGTDPSEETGTEIYTYASDEAPDEIELSLALVDEPLDNGSIVVEQLWVQSRLAATGRDDRAVFRFSTDDAKVILQLPVNARLKNLTLDGKAISRAGSLESSIAVKLPPRSEWQQHVVEAAYALPRSGTQGGAATAEFPKLLGTTPQQSFWELILPGDEYLLFTPHGMTPEVKDGRDGWKWHGFYWRRQPAWNQSELEWQLGAVPRKELPGTYNRYVFSSFGSVQPTALATAGRFQIILVVSSSVFFAGLLLIYFPALRHPAVMLAGGVALCALCFVYHQAALQVGQLAVLGITFVAVVQLLRWLVERPRKKPAIIHGSSRAAHETGSTETLRMPTENSSQFRTAAAPLSVQLPEPSTHVPQS